jgi:Na+-transporting NADH:ubiquinone oxidoreductase subunit NqrB
MMLRSVYSDPRHIQLAVLSLLLGYGLLVLDFEVRPEHALVIASVALAVQLVATRITAAHGFSWRDFDPRSAAITALSLCLLLRTTSTETAALAALLAVTSKFVLRVGGKHVFNPSAFGLVAVLLLRDDAWLSAGQWGSAPLLAALVACLGSLVLRRTARSDVTWAFLASYLALIFGRAMWLGDPPAIPLHALHNGALLLFAFFMISDPKTLPDARAGRIAFAAAVAAGGFAIQYAMFRTNGLLWSLVLLAPFVPLLDRLWPARHYVWNGSALTVNHTSGERPHVPTIDLDPRLPGFGAIR